MKKKNTICTRRARDLYRWENKKGSESEKKNTKNVDPSRLSQIGNPKDDDWIVRINLTLEITPLSSPLPTVDAPLLHSLAS